MFCWLLKCNLFKSKTYLECGCRCAPDFLPSTPQALLPVGLQAGELDLLEESLVKLCLEHS